MAAIDTQKLLVRPLAGAIIRRYRLGGTGIVGNSVYMATDGDVEQTDADAEASSVARGIIIANGTNGKTDGVAGDMVDVVVYGPVEMGNVTPLTIGASVFVSPTAGAMDQTASATSGDFNGIVGWAEAATVIFVNPPVAAATVVA